MPQVLFEEFPIEIVSMMQKIFIKDRLYYGKYTRIYKNDLVVRLPRERWISIADLAYRRVLAVWSHATKKRRPTVSLILLGNNETVMANTATPEEFYSFLIESMAKN